MTAETKSRNVETSWLERHVNFIMVCLVIVCLGTLLAEWWYRPFFDEHHPAHFPIENWFGFQAAFGFVAFIVIVFIGRFLRLLIRREEDYYDS